MHCLSLLLVPEPQDLVQGVHSAQLVHCSHWPVPQSSTLLLSPWQRARASTHSRCDVLSPPPQLTVQADHSLQAVKAGQGLVLQSLASLSSPGQPDSPPCLSGSKHWRCLL